ncbi:hypothetical protein CFC21_004861 [Triticum aestivum]|uniref:Uncharacterized protein n=2 Tax=Triticum aestivum TaxID=4565 RepID=A0A3B5YQE1_WHEAT|nr:hypothetical protein CFC21_004861 [Triticum aestivum]
MGGLEPAGAGEGRDGIWKTSWPEVVGWPVQNAVVRIKGDRPDISFIAGGTGGQWPPGHNPSRVVILSNEAGVLVKTPVVG